MTIENLYADIPISLPEELETLLAEGHKFRLKRILSRGQSTDWYDQDEDEWVALLSGAAQLVFEDGEQIALKPGDFLHIAGHRRHRVAWTDPEQTSVWLALYFKK